MLFLPCARFLILCGCLWHSVPSQNRMCAWFFFFFTRGKFQSGKYSCRVDVPGISHNALKTGYSGTDKLWQEAWHAIQFTVHDVPLNCEYEQRRTALNFIDMILVSKQTSGLQEPCAMRNYYFRPENYISSSYVVLSNSMQSLAINICRLMYEKACLLKSWLKGINYYAILDVIQFGITWICLGVHI